MCKDAQGTGWLICEKHPYIFCKRDYRPGQAKLEAKRRQRLKIHAEDQKGEDGH